MNRKINNLSDFIKAYENCRTDSEISNMLGIDISLIEDIRESNVNDNPEDDIDR